MFDALSVAEKVFLFCAAVGGGLFVLRSLLMFAGLGDHDLDGGVFEADGVPESDFKMVSVHGLTAFFFMFGLVGFLVLRNQGERALPVAVLASFGAGFVIMCAIAKLFSLSRKLQSNGAIHLRDAIGCEATVYLEIRPGEVGKIQVTVRDAFKVFDARCSDMSAKLRTGDRVRVVSVGDVLIVERI